MEQLANYQATGNLNGSINNSVTTITLTSTASFPSSYPYRIRIDDEIMKVTGTPGSNQFTVSRADGSTTAASHSSGANVQAVLTKEALDSLVSIQSGGSEISTRRIINFIGGSVVDNSGSARCDITLPGWESVSVLPVIGNFTGANMGSGSDLGTLTQSGNNLFLRDSVQSGTWGDHCRVQYQASGSTPWTLKAKIIPSITGANFQQCGVCFYDSSSHKMADIRFTPGTNTFTIGKWTDYNTYSADYASFNGYNLFPLTWFKLNDNGTNRIISVSADGLNWIQLHSIGRTDFMTANAAAFFVNANNHNGSSPFDAGITLVSWTF